MKQKIHETRVQEPDERQYKTMISERMKMNKLSLQLPRFITWKLLLGYAVSSGEQNNPRVK